MAKYVLTKEEVNESSIFEHVAVAAIQPQPSQYASNIHFLITLRADFLGYALSYRPFADALQHNDLKLGPMTRQELQVAIQKPAQKLRIQIEAGLTERILNEISQQPGNLPLIEFALTLLWEKQQEGRLTHAAYDEIGGVEQALASYADNIYEDLSQEEKQHAKRVFVQLVSPGEGTEDTRRLATRVQIGEEGWNLVVKLSNARLVVCSRDEILGEETVEVAHEALITRWNRLRKWMELYREFRLWQERFRTRIHEWERSNYSQSELLRGVMLEESENWLLERSKELNQAEQKFIRVSREKQEWEKRRMESLKQISQISMAFPTAVKLSNLVEDVYQFVSNVVDVSPPKTQLSLNVLQFVNLALLIL